MTQTKTPILDQYLRDAMVASKEVERCASLVKQSAQELPVNQDMVDKLGQISAIASRLSSSMSDLTLASGRIHKP